MRRRSLLTGIGVAAAALGSAAMAQGCTTGANITAPVPNRVFQQVGGIASFRIQWAGNATSVRLKNAQGNTVAEAADGLFVNISPGWYDAVLIAGIAEVHSIKVGVGDVYVVAGQSNGVSPLQPANYSYSRPSSPGLVIVSDYYGQGSHAFIDSYSTSTTGSIAWIACGKALNRLYPVMFVNIAKGNTSYHEWAYVHVTELFAAYGVYRPKAVLWLQGESECQYPPLTDSFAMFNACVESLRQITVTPIVVAKNSSSLQPPAGYSYWPVLDAQQRVIDIWPHVHQGPSTDQFRHGSVEFLGDDMRLVGEAFASKLVGLSL